MSDVLDPDGEVCDHLVVMRRMPAERRLSHLAEAGVDLDGEIRQIAHQVATLHGRSERTARGGRRGDRPRPPGLGGRPTR